jgi:hypothetical protein
MASKGPSVLTIWKEMVSNDLRCSSLVHTCPLSRLVEVGVSLWPGGRCLVCLPALIEHVILHTKKPSFYCVNRQTAEGEPGPVGGRREAGRA